MFSSDSAVYTDSVLHTLDKIVCQQFHLKCLHHHSVSIQHFITGVLLVQYTQDSVCICQAAGHFGYWVCSLQ